MLDQEYRCRYLGRLGSRGLQNGLASTSAPSILTKLTNSFVDLLNDALCPDGINFSRFNYVKAAVPIVLVVAQSAECCSNSSMNVRVISKQSFLTRVVEVCAVVYRRLMAWCTSEDLRSPGVQMGIEVYDCDRTICFVHAAEKRKSNRVISTKRNQTRKSSSFLGYAKLFCVR